MLGKLGGLCPLSRTGIAVVCAAVGLVAIPALLTSQSLPSLWLAAEVLLALCILALVPPQSRALGDAITRHVRQSSSITPSQSRLIGQLLVLLATLITVQAMVRRPLALTLAADGRAASTFEAGVAASALTLVLGLGMWLFHTARPVVQSLCLAAIDAAIPTVGGVSVAERATEATASQDNDATVLAPRRTTDTHATVPAVAEATVAADPDATLRLHHPRA